jgi:predicted  nucleic acid-binding Zn-ribbon protein
MFSRVKRVAAASVAAAATLLAGAGFGCDSDVRRADRQVQTDLHKSIELTQEGKEQSAKQAQQLLESAAANASISPATKANAKALLAQTELENARTAQRKVDRLQIELARLSWETTQLGNQIGMTNAFVAGYQKYDPKDAKATIEKNIADATGGPDKPAWFQHEKTTLPTLAAVRQETARLEGEISKHQDKIKALGTDRDRANTEAEQASQQAQAGKRGETLDAFRRASELRKQASDLATQIESEQAALVPLQHDLSVAQAEQAVLEEVIAQLQAQRAALDNGWQIVQQQIASQSSLAKGILAGEGGGSTAQANATVGGSIATKAAEIEKLVAELKSTRDQAISDAQNAADHYKQAADAAREMASELQKRLSELGPDRAEAKIWEQLRNAVSPPAFQLQQSAAQRTLASLFASRAAECDLRITLRNSLTPVLQSAGLAVPPSVQAADLEREREKALKDASEAYSKANDALENVVEGQRDESLRNAAEVARILTLYGWSMLEKQANDPKADEHLQLAIQYRKAAAEQNMPLPALPSGLGEPAGKAAATTTAAAEGATTAPASDTTATAPAETPATAPAEAPATQPAAPAAPG